MSRRWVVPELGFEITSGWTLKVPVPRRPPRSPSSLHMTDNSGVTEVLEPDGAAAAGAVGPQWGRQGRAYSNQSDQPCCVHTRPGPQGLAITSGGRYRLAFFANSNAGGERFLRRESPMMKPVATRRAWSLSPERIQ